MTTEKGIYGVYLEDYSLPRTASEAKCCYGSMDQILNLAEHLSAGKGTAVRYGGFIRGLAVYRADNSVTHDVAGREYPLLTPVREICRHTFQLFDQKWYCTTHAGAVYVVEAQKVSACQMVVQTESGYERCLRASFKGLSYCLPTLGWVSPENLIGGFPGVVTWENNIHAMHLFVSQQHYEANDLELAMEDAEDPYQIDLSTAAKEIVGEG